MALSNYNDISTGSHADRAGFQFEFYCQSCQRTWKSPFKPYRIGQLTGLLGRLTYFFNGVRSSSQNISHLAEWRSGGAHQSALDSAMRQAEQMYAACGSCGKLVCDACYVARDQTCQSCTDHQHGRSHAPAGDRNGVSGSTGAGPACPNCSTPSGGGRFCAECGFDMASTHKSCPGCGGMCERATRFCADCGHGF